MKLIKILLSTLLISCVIGYVYATYGPFYRTEVVNEVVSLKSKEPRIFEFTVDRTDSYELSLYTEKPFDLRGQRRVRSGLLGLVWSIHTRDDEVDAGKLEMTDEDRKYDGMTDWLRLDDIELRRGSSYSLVLQSTGDVEEWNGVKQYVWLGLRPDYTGLRILSLGFGFLSAIALLIVFAIGYILEARAMPVVSKKDS